MKHDWSNGDKDGGVVCCRACLIPKNPNVAEAECPATIRNPRVSVFADLPAIGQRAAEIHKQEHPTT